MLNKITRLILNILRAYLILVASFVVLASLLLILNLHPWQDFDFWFSELMSRSCHQGESRLVNLNEINLPLCSRCYAIYLGTLFSLIYSYRKFFYAASILILGFGLKIIEYYLGLDYSHLLALVSGLMIGYGLISVIDSLLGGKKNYDEKNNN